MKIKLKDIIENQENLEQLIKVKFPVKVSYRIKRLVDKLNPELKTYSESRTELFKELGIYNEEKDTYTIPKDSMKDFAQKAEELLDTDIEVEFDKIKIDELGTLDIESKLLVSWIFE